MLIYYFKSNYMYNLTLSDMKSNWFIALHVSQTVASCLNGQFLNRAGYRVRYFLGTDRITSIPSSIEKHLVVRLISSTSVRQYACSTRCVRLEVMWHRSISIWHPRERFESVRSRLLSISRACVYNTQTEARDARGDFSLCRLTKWGHTWTTSPDLLWESLHEHFTVWFE